MCCKDLERRDGSSIFWDMKETGMLEESVGSGGLAFFNFLFSVSVIGFFIRISSFIALVELCCWVFLFWIKV